MRSLAIALSVLVLVAVVQDVYGRPRRRGERQRGGQGGGERGQQEDRRGPVRSEHGSSESEHGEHRRSHPHPRICLLINTTTNVMLCNKFCPDFTRCQRADATHQKIDTLDIHVCFPYLVCEVISNNCPEGTTCDTVGGEQRCVPETNEEDSSEEESTGADSTNCRRKYKEIKRAHRTRPSQPGRRLHKPCLLRNTTSNIVLCDKPQSCPSFTECRMTNEDRQRHVIDSLEVHFCIPKSCETSACPSGSTCDPESSLCRPDEPRTAGQSEGEAQDAESCKDELKAIKEANRPRREGSADGTDRDRERAEGRGSRRDGRGRRPFRGDGAGRSGFRGGERPSRQPEDDDEIDSTFGQQPQSSPFIGQPQWNDRRGPDF